MSENTGEKKLNLKEYLLFFGAGLFLFFLAAFAVVLVRTRGGSKVMMPDLVGQNYTDIHNELMRLRLKVRLETRNYGDKNDGEILYQSITPGKTIASGNKLYLTINVGVNRIIVPDLKGQQLTSAKSLLEKVLSGETYVTLPLGGVTYIPAENGQSPGTVVDQIPEAGKITTNREKVYLLVTEEKTLNGQSGLDKFEGQPLQFAAMSLSKRKMQFKVNEIISTKDKKENGLVAKSEKNGENYQFSVNYFAPDISYHSGFEKIEYKVGKSGKFNGRIVSEDIEKDEGKEVFRELNLSSGEVWKFVPFRVGNSRLELIDSATGSKEKSFAFNAELRK
ncbi:MAG TPA: PASTA domain-containing protein [Leptospiraceae bacterium]|nr:PASTA domain-containing protein [Leptospiraceae bacterium]HMY66161.1 PASTA domain-containing protein [Leptospiraceae bacterium]HNF16409.1 PASTA domain-containing protein [Leptospiraceae bacterium]HNF23195.1 PASTA domain-containing protein [Leptospiraceae bacterium]HNM04459.1 PASTA domain-containing protein [Leptospiraceae bacterium]